MKMREAMSLTGLLLQTPVVAAAADGIEEAHAEGLAEAELLNVAGCKGGEALLRAVLNDPAWDAVHQYLAKKEGVTDLVLTEIADGFAECAEAAL